MKKTGGNPKIPIDLLALETEVKKMISQAPDAEFRQWYEDIKPQLRKKFLNRVDYKPTALKRVIRKVLYRDTLELPQARVVQFFSDFWFLNRFYFGPGLNHQLYHAQRSVRQHLRRIEFRVRAVDNLIHTRIREHPPKAKKILAPAPKKSFWQKLKAIFSGEAGVARKRRHLQIRKLEIRSFLQHHNFKFQYQKSVPKFITVVDLAFFFKMNLNQIWKYCYMQAFRRRNNKLTAVDPNKPVETNNPFYKHLFIKKSNGRKRLISVPNPELKQMQQQILRELLYCVQCPPLVTGFLPGRSILSNAERHLGAQTLVKIDLRDFFPSIQFHQVVKVFQGFGYKIHIAGILACICTDFASETTGFYHKRRFLPQGAPTSPMIANLYASHLDTRVNALWNKKGFHYSRYADDLTFSSPVSNANVQAAIKKTQEIILEEGLQPNLAKTKVFRKGNQLKVTGVVINQKPTLSREWIHNLRASLHHAKMTPNLSKEEHEALKHQIQGKIAFLNMINPQKARIYSEQFHKIFLNTTSESK